jgi:uncharacterized protein (TIGR02145 family)
MESETGTFIDPRDGKIYKTVKIGEQVWMAENLNFDCPGSKCYDNDPKNADKYGRLYDWETAKKACLPGWHLPSREEWYDLVDFEGGKQIAGKELKAKSGWTKVCFYEKSKFLVLPGGFGDSNGRFYDVGHDGYWWSATESNSSNAYYQHMFHDGNAVLENHYDKSRLFSVRCVKD